MLENDFLLLMSYFVLAQVDKNLKLTSDCPIIDSVEKNIKEYF